MLNSSSGGYIDHAHEGGGGLKDPRLAMAKLSEIQDSFENKVVGIGLNYICSSISFFLFVVI